VVHLPEEGKANAALLKIIKLDTHVVHLPEEGRQS
jgi:uncharacterized protein YggU (UPF0235/DUF167 family)